MKFFKSFCVLNYLESKLLKYIDLMLFGDDLYK